MHGGSAILDELVVSGTSAVHASLFDRKGVRCVGVGDAENVLIALTLGLQSEDQVIDASAAQQLENFLIRLGALLKGCIYDSIISEEEILQAGHDVAKSAVLRRSVLRHDAPVLQKSRRKYRISFCFCFFSKNNFFVCVYTDGFFIFSPSDDLFAPRGIVFYFFFFDLFF